MFVLTCKDYFTFTQTTGGAIYNLTIGPDVLDSKGQAMETDMVLTTVTPRDGSYLFPEEVTPLAAGDRGGAPLGPNPSSGPNSSLPPAS